MIIVVTVMQLHHLERQEIFKAIPTYEELNEICPMKEGNAKATLERLKEVMTKGKNCYVSYSLDRTRTIYFNYYPETIDCSVRSNLDLKDSHETDEVSQSDES